MNMIRNGGLMGQRKEGRRVGVKCRALTPHILFSFLFFLILSCSYFSFLFFFILSYSCYYFFIFTFFFSLFFPPQLFLYFFSSLDDVHRLCLAYVASCVEMSITYKVLKPHLDFIIFSVVFPTLCLSPADIRYGTIRYNMIGCDSYNSYILDN